MQIKEIYIFIRSIFSISIYEVEKDTLDIVHNEAKGLNSVL